MNLVRGEALFEIGLPGGEMIDPGGDGELMHADFVDFEFALPAVVDEGLHVNFRPIGGGCGAMANDGVKQRMAIGEYIGFDADGFADGGFGDEAAVVDAGGDVFDDGAGAARFGEAFDGAGNGA